MIQSIAIRVHVRCPQCLGQVIVGAVADRVRCDACGASVAMTAPHDWFQNDTLFRRALDHQTASILAVGDAPEVHFEKRAAACHGCQRPFDLAEIFGAEKTASLRCSSCATTMTVRPIPATFMPSMSMRGVVVGEQNASHDAPAAAQTHAVVLACMSCGGALHVDGKERMVDCAFCKTSNYLPDPVWARLHPAKQVVTFFVVADIA